MAATADRIARVCDDVKQMLLDKNAAYGDSASDPLRIFSKADKLEAIRVRVDDKLSRIQRGSGYPGDNDVRDLVGYLLLYLANDGTDTNPCEDIATAPDQVQRYEDKDGDIWIRQPGGYYACETLRHMGVKSFAFLADYYSPLTPNAA